MIPKGLNTMRRTFLITALVFSVLNLSSARRNRSLTREAPQAYRSDDVLDAARGGRGAH